MSAPFWLYCALASLLFDTIFCQTCDGSVGNFDVPITKRSALVTERENDWKLWCTSPFGSTCTRTNRGLTTGHDAVSSQSGSVRDAMVSIEMCYAFCMNRFPPDGVQSDTYPFGPADITSYSCSEAFDASVCLSACLYTQRNVRTTFDIILGSSNIAEGSCEEKCKESRGVCERAFAPSTSQENAACHQRCLNSTICEEMCNLTASLPPSTGNSFSLTANVRLTETHPRLTRPLNNRTLWEEGVLEFSQVTSDGITLKGSSPVYGLLWKLTDSKKRTKEYYMAHHMTFFFLPDEIMFHRVPTNLLALPRGFECTRFDVVTAAVSEQSTSQFSTADFACTPGGSVPDPPMDVSMNVALCNYTQLSQLTFHFKRSPEEVYCANYVAKFTRGGPANYLHKNVSIGKTSLSFQGDDLFVGGKSILDSNLTLSLACVTWSDTDFDPLEWPVQTVLSTDVSLRAITYCGSHIGVPTLIIIDASNPDTGLWSLDLTFKLPDPQISPQKFLYLGEGQSIVYNVIDSEDSKKLNISAKVLLEVGVFVYNQRLQNITPGENVISVKLEESALFRAELMQSDCVTCCESEGGEFTRPISLSAVRPSPPMNISLVSQKYNVSTSSLAISLQVRPPEHPAGNIVSFRVKFGGPKLPNFFEETLPYTVGGSGNQAYFINFQAPFHADLDDQWNFQVAAVSNFAAESSWANFSIPSPYSIVPQTAYIGEVITGVLAFVGIVLIIILIALCIGCYLRGNKVVFVPSVWFGTRTADTQEDQEEAMLTFEPDSWELDPEKITMDHLLGEGSFGQVYKGVLLGPVRTPGCETATSLSVAVKLLGMNASLVEKDNFLKEIELMKRVSYGRCQYIVNTIGCCSLQEPLALVLEYMAYGDLLSYLRTSRRVVRMKEMLPDTDDGTHVVKFNEYVHGPGSEDPMSPSENPYSRLGDLEPANLISFAYQIAAGMEYLTSLGLVHRDLACRNVLLGENKQLKVSDFGLAREGELYVKTTAGRLPLRWMAIEAITERVFTQKTDVWAFGVVLWEIATLGGCPYPSITNHALLPFLVRGNRMEKPNNCSPDMYEIMLGCWKANPDERLGFTELRSLFEAMMVREKETYINISNIEELLPYYPMSALCDTTDGSDDNEGSLSPKDYEVPITHTNRFRMSQLQSDPTILHMDAGAVGEGGANGSPPALLDPGVLVDGKKAGKLVNTSFDDTAELVSSEDGDVKMNGGL